VSDAAIVYLVLTAVVVLFIWGRLPVEVVAVGAALTLAATDVINVDQSLAGFGDSTVIFIAALFIVSEGIDSTGITTWAGQWIIAKAGDDRTRLIVLMMLLVAALTAVISVNGAVAALLPMVVVVAVRSHQLSSRLLIPLAFGAHAGSLLALTGTPVHILVSNAAIDAGEAGFNYFEFGLVGIPIVIGAIGLVLAFGSKLLPDRHPEAIPRDLSDHARTLVRQYAPGEWIARLEVTETSPLVGSQVAAIEIAGYADMSIVEVLGRLGAIHDESTVVPGAVITVRGPSQSINQFTLDNDLDRRPCALSGEAELMNRQVGVVEVVIPPRSQIVGEHVFPGMTTSSGDFVVLAVQRQGEDLGLEPSRLAVGDTMLLQGTWDALDRELDSAVDVMVVDAPATVRRQAVPMGPGATRALAIMVGMVVLLATGVVPAAVAALLAAGALILTRVLTIPQAYRAVSWTTVILVGAMIPLSTAVEQSGVAADIAELLVKTVGNAGPHALLLGLFIITAIFGQLISNMATALIVIPIAVSASVDLGVSVRPVLMCVTVAAAAALLTPVATPANLMVMEPGGYKFGDYWKLGLPMMALYLLVAVLVVPVFWPF
jgi:di/tricarboxylate transporter